MALTHSMSTWKERIRRQRQKFSNHNCRGFTRSRRPPAQTVTLPPRSDEIANYSPIKILSYAASLPRSSEQQILACQVERCNLEPLQCVFVTNVLRV